jgi:hypothetical protein
MGKFFLHAASHRILNRWKNYFSQLLHVHRVSDVRQMKIHTTEPSHFEVDIATVILKSYKLPGTDQIPAELFNVRCEILNSEIKKLINYIWNKEELSQQCKVSIIVQIYKKGDRTNCSIYQGI